eukprot:gene20685-25357_t
MPDLACQTSSPFPFGLSLSKPASKPFDKLKANGRDQKHDPFSQPTPMNHATLKLFIDVSELGSLTKTALLYGTTQPHISRQISELERECGGRLFQRTGRGVVLTALGEQIMPRIRAWLLDTDQLHNDIKKASGTPVGTVRIGVLPSTAHPLVSTLYYRLKESFPLVKLVV